MPRARHFFRRRRGSTTEDPATARRIARPGRVQRSVDRQALHARSIGELGEQVVNATRIGAADDGDADRLRAGGNPEPDATTRRVPSEQLHPLPVQRDLELVVDADGWQSEQPHAGPADSELVFGVERKHVLHQQAAARAERQPLAMPGL